MAKAKAQDIVEGFWQYLKKSENLGLLPEIVTELNRRADEVGTLATVFSSQVLDAKQEEKITNIIKSNFGINHAIFKVDTALIGGIKVKIGDEVLDLSLQNRLDNLTKAI